MKRETTSRRPKETRKALIKAAADSIEELGYDGTNTNKIAIQAGFAPQTFYRHFENKLEVFLAVYEHWVKLSGITYDDLRGSQNAASYAIAHHKKFLNFRRALRHLAIIEPKVREARAASRLKQIHQLQERLPHLADADVASLAVSLLQIERIIDACVEGEFTDLGMTHEQAEAGLSNLIHTVFGNQTPVEIFR